MPRQIGLIRPLCLALIQKTVQNRYGPYGSMAPGGVDAKKTLCPIEWRSQLNTASVQSVAVTKVWVRPGQGCGLERDKGVG